MALTKTKHLFKKIGLGLVILGFSLAVAVLVDYFYQKHFGEPITIPLPQTISNIISTPTPEEKEVTKQEVVEYKVAPDKPRYFSLPILGIHNARILPVGKDLKTHEIGTPPGIYDVGWFNQSGLPGKNQTIILDGHNGGPAKDGIFKRLGNATAGNTMSIERGDGQIFTYKITDNYTVKLDDFTQDAMDKVLAKINDQETVAIITCSGRWLKDKQTYDQRTIVKAVRQ